jgi:hypothetical protein
MVGFDGMLKIRDDQRHDGGKLGNQKDAQEPGSKPSQFPR